MMIATNDHRGGDPSFPHGRVHAHYTPQPLHHSRYTLTSTFDTTLQIRVKNASLAAHHLHGKTVAGTNEV